jgi:hypothetical protein
MAASIVHLKTNMTLAGTAGVDGGVQGTRMCGSYPFTCPHGLQPKPPQIGIDALGAHHERPIFLYDHCAAIFYRVIEADAGVELSQNIDGLFV